MREKERERTIFLSKDIDGHNLLTSGLVCKRYLNETDSFLNPMSSSENDNAIATALLNLGKEMGNAGLPTVMPGFDRLLRFWDPKYGVTARLKSVTLFWSS